MFPPFNLLLTSPKWLLHLEGLAVFAAPVAGCRELGDSWVKFALLFFVPDIFMAGYFFGTKMGAAVYNLGHTCASPILLSLAAYLLSFPPAYPVSLIWIAPIGFDRLLGYGLSTPRHVMPPIWEKYDPKTQASLAGFAAKKDTGVQIVSGLELWNRTFVTAFGRQEQ